MRNFSDDLSTGDIIERLTSIYGVKNDGDLSEIFDVKRSTFGSWKSRNRIPYELCVNVSIDKKIDLMWLLTGQGSMYAKEGVSDQPVHYAPAQNDLIKNQRHARLNAFLEDWFKHKNDDHQAWLEVQIENCVQPYKDFKSNKTIEQKSPKKRVG